MPCRTYVEIAENAHLGYYSIALSHPSAPGRVHRLWYCKHRRLVYVVGEHPPRSSDLIGEVALPEGSTFTESEGGDFTVALPFSSCLPADDGPGEGEGVRGTVTGSGYARAASSGGLIVQVGAGYGSRK